MCIRIHVCTHRETHILVDAYTLMRTLVHTHCAYLHTHLQVCAHTHTHMLFPLIVCSH